MLLRRISQYVTIGMLKQISKKRKTPKRTSSFCFGKIKGGAYNNEGQANTTVLLMNFSKSRRTADESWFIGETICNIKAAEDIVIGNAVRHRRFLLKYSTKDPIGIKMGTPVMIKSLPRF